MLYAQVSESCVWSQSDIFVRFFGSLDRANIGNARIAGLAPDLELDGTKFNVVLLVFYVPYILIDIPSNWVIKHFKAGYYLSFLIITWVSPSHFVRFTLGANHLIGYGM